MVGLIGNTPSSRCESPAGDIYPPNPRQALDTGHGAPWAHQWIIDELRKNDDEARFAYVLERMNEPTRGEKVLNFLAYLCAAMLAICVFSLLIYNVVLGG